MQNYKTDMGAMCVKPPSAISISSRNSSPSGKIDTSIIEN